MELPITLEDSSVISEKAAELFTMPTTEVRTLTLTFDQEIRNLVSVGDELSAEDILCIIVDSSGESNFDEQITQSLSLLARNSPRSKYDGKVGRIEVLYSGFLEDASATLRDLITKADRERTKRAKALGEEPVTGEVEDLELDTVQIKIYIDNYNGTADGDKIVFGNQLKSVIGQVMHGVNQTASGQELDAIFGFTSAENRIVNSFAMMGTTIALQQAVTQLAVKAYRRGG